MNKQASERPRRSRAVGNTREKIKRHGGQRRSKPREPHIQWLILKPEEAYISCRVRVTLGVGAGETSWCQDLEDIVSLGLLLLANASRTFQTASWNPGWSGGGGFQRALSQVYTVCLSGQRENTWALPFTLLGTTLFVLSLDTEGIHKIVLGDGTFCLENGRKLPRVWGRGVPPVNTVNNVAIYNVHSWEPHN